jgi:hypothetical protein
MVIGIALGLATLLWPFRRGALGAVVNLLLAVSGAAMGGLLGIYLGHCSPDGTECLTFVAAGTLATVCLGHAAWLATAGRRQPYPR